MYVHLNMKHICRLTIQKSELLPGIGREDLDQAENEAAPVSLVKHICLISIAVRQYCINDDSAITGTLSLVPLKTMSFDSLVDPADGSDFALSRSTTENSPYGAVEDEHGRYRGGITMCYRQRVEG
jgi:hypothetical protein